MNWQQSLKDYKLFLKIERGLSENTIINYGLDIAKLITYLDLNAVEASPISITKEQLQEFIYTYAKELTASSQARLISGLKGYFEYLVFEELRTDNPTELIEAPKIGRKLPDTLSEEEVNQIIDAIDLSTPQGERNRAIFETLYGCGLRVSEVLNLKLSDLFFDEGYILVTGKGDKQRFVPIAPVTQKYIEIYRDEIRIHESPKPEFKNILFLNRRG
ncbi:MAG: tyrosine-type recombinase/integrase, partial [Bacteroidota bacterium]|nr:tyrosine-type recombinase/integrase [Bacteroidota bacterium]